MVGCIFLPIKPPDTASFELWIYCSVFVPTSIVTRCNCICERTVTRVESSSKCLVFSMRKHFIMVSDSHSAVLQILACRASRYQMQTSKLEIGLSKPQNLWAVKSRSMQWVYSPISPIVINLRPNIYRKHIRNKTWQERWTSYICWKSYGYTGTAFQ